ncbi:AN1-like Zinc finger-containing protein, putative [Eimeria tenella]|uniref:AN1-like Zinc finger-containing protein, putative n=1 Tax=Eimeria tenella TaxID=5802 RepID=U6KV32_EIMTE|nr:AN1-like Zinc finger-containing protein, putative [Eimeria tenella]CDJ39365.1 AN1-like Zinc finger-containing protein, putative [Eimeria tenella]|eukprot:XP_013230120.1 AN1-like Zinc finger-containing protein, putative [Eimeria tenella]
MDLETDEAAAVRHRPQCRPELRAQREKIKKGRKCPVNGCKERLTAISSIHCPHCQADICIKHRLKEDHNCELLKATRKERKRSSLFRQISSASRGVKSKGNSYPSNTGKEEQHVLDHVTDLTVYGIAPQCPIINQFPASGGPICNPGSSISRTTLLY